MPEAQLQNDDPSTLPDGLNPSTFKAATINGSAARDGEEHIQRVLKSAKTGATAATDEPHGAGTVDSATPRVVEASDSALTVAAQAIQVAVETPGLPSGAATAANQVTEIAGLASIDGKITAVNTGAVVVASSALPSGAATEAKQDAQTTLLAGGLPAALGAGGGVKVDGSGTALPVSLASVPSHAVTNAGTFAVQDSEKVADDATFTPGTTKVQPIGGYVVAHGAAPDAADAGDAGAPLMNRHRVLWVMAGNPNAKSSVYNTTAAGTDDNILPAISSGTKYAVTQIQVTLDEACTVGVAVRIGFGTASVPALGSSQADAVDDVLLYHPGMVPGTILTRGDGSGILGVGGDGAELRITNEVPSGGTLGVVVSWYPIES